jgi:hypothetical protein
LVDETGSGYSFNFSGLTSFLSLVSLWCSKKFANVLKKFFTGRA